MPHSGSTSICYNGEICRFKKFIQADSSAEAFIILPLSWLYDRHWKKQNEPKLVDALIMQIRRIPDSQKPADFPNGSEPAKSIVWREQGLLLLLVFFIPRIVRGLFLVFYFLLKRTLDGYPFVIPNKLLSLLNIQLIQFLLDFVNRKR